MKRSEIINYLEKKGCIIKWNVRNGNHLNICVSYLTGSDIIWLDNKGLIVFLTGTTGMEEDILIEITGYIEWD